eukprot:GHVU01008737.1.p1 GENE.GHVU01008737.1~~GHVU01008737.1.p1  ORF type:complete len:139 (+),score=5.02 GHVU01008737.1:745-1161(+)
MRVVGVPCAGAETAKNASCGDRPDMPDDVGTMLLLPTDKVHLDRFCIYECLPVCQRGSSFGCQMAWACVWADVFASHTHSTYVIASTSVRIKRAIEHAPTPRRDMVEIGSTWGSHPAKRATRHLGSFGQSSLPKLALP